MSLNSDPPSDFRVSSFEEGLIQGFAALEVIEDGYQDMRPLRKSYFLLVERMEYIWAETRHSDLQ